MRNKLRIGLAAAIAGATLLSTAGAALATPPPAPAGSNTGFDEVDQLVASGGSDTTYSVSTELSRLYNGSPGCLNIQGSSPSDSCIAGQTGVAPSATGGHVNWDHDLVAQSFPTGSGNGMKCLLGTLTCNIPLDVVRSSRKVGQTGSAAEIANLAQFGYARDGIAAVSFGRAATGVNPAVTNITQAQLHDIYNCDNNPATGARYTWGDLNPFDTNPTDPVIPVLANTGSGTSLDFATYMGFADAASILANTAKCVHTVVTPAGTATAPSIENDAKPLRDDTVAPAAGVFLGAEATTPMATLYSQHKILWYFSYGASKTLPNQALNLQRWKVAGKTLSNTTVNNLTWPIARYLYQVTKKTDADASASVYPALAGTGLGKGGAVREFTRFICANTGDNGVDGDNGNLYFDEIDSAIFITGGFVTVPSSKREWGRCTITGN